MDQRSLVQYPAGRTGAYVVPSGVTGISSGAFSGSTGLTHVTLPISLVNIYSYAFSDCTSLKSITIPNNAIVIWDYAFANCASLKEAIITSNVRFYGEGIFYACTNLTSLYFDGHVPRTPMLTPYGDPLDPLDRSLDDMFYQNNRATVYYHAGTAGWRSIFLGRPTALWIQPSYTEWVFNSGLLDRYPNASDESDDPDQDGQNNQQEMMAGTDPTDPHSAMKFELAARPGDLTDEDRTLIAPGQLAFYFQTVPGKTYELQGANSLGGNWQTMTTVAATTTQKRFVVAPSMDRGFYRLLVKP
jgi:hypothetical protein